MYKNEFDNRLRQNKEYNAYMFYGQSPYLINYYSDLIAKNLAKGDEIEKLYFDDYEFKYVKDKLLQSSLFSSNNIFLIKIDKKLPKKEVDALIEACNINPHSKVIFSCLGDLNFKTMEKSFGEKTNSVFVRFFQPSNAEAISILKTQADFLNLNYDINALNHLYFMHKNNLSLCINDLKKLSVLEEKITSNIVNTHCFGIGGVSFEDFLLNLLTNKDIDSQLETLLEEGMNEIFLLTQIISFIQQLFMISAYARTMGMPNPKEILGFIPPKKVWETKSKLAINIKPEKYQEMLDYLLNIEYELKSSKIDKIDLYLQACLRKFTVLFR